MLVKCVAVPRERTPKKVEVILTRINPSRKNVVRLSARIAEPVLCEPADIFVSDSFDSELENDNLNGIIPIDEYYCEDQTDADRYTNDLNELTDIFFEEADDIESEITDSAEVDISSMISELNYDIDAIESDLLTQFDDADNDPKSSDESIIQRHFIRDDTGKLYESDRENADGHEVACYDNAGKLKRACGVIRKGTPSIIPESDDDIYGMAAADMFFGFDN